MDKRAKIIPFKTLKQRAIEEQKRNLKNSMRERRIELLEDTIDRNLLDLNSLAEEE